MKEREYKIKISNRAKRMRITIRPDSSVIVTLPLRTKIKEAERFISQKRAWIESHLNKIKQPTHRIIRPHPMHIASHKEKAHVFIMEKLHIFNKHYNFKWNCVRVKKLSSRWGSCSEQGNLNFNYLLPMLPPHLIEYVIVHELCHLKELNHSPQFWKLVEQTIPNYLKIKKELKNIY